MIHAAVYRLGAARAQRPRQCSGRHGRGTEAAIEFDEQLLQELTQRYEPTDVPDCRRCGAPLGVVCKTGPSRRCFASITCSNGSD